MPQGDRWISGNITPRLKTHCKASAASYGMDPSSDRVLILQHLTTDGPAGLGTWLRQQGIAFDVFDSSAGQAFPRSVDGYRALAVLGGEMSANDALPSLRQAENLILQAMAKDRPVLGLCLGGQLMARALGARVDASPLPEVGWHCIERSPSQRALDWLGDAPQPVVFQWHYEAFSLPRDAERLASSTACPNQAFTIGPHLGLQFHAEVDEPKLTAWAEAMDTRYLAAQEHPSVHPAQRLRVDTPIHLAAQQRMARRIYQRWLGRL